MFKPILDLQCRGTSKNANEIASSVHLDQTVLIEEVCSESARTHLFQYLYFYGNK